MASTSWVVAQSQQALKQRIYSHSKQKLKDNLNSKDILPRRLNFVKPKKQQNARPMTSCSMSSSTSSSSIPPTIDRQRSDFNAASVHLFDESNIPQLMHWKKSGTSVGGGLRNLGNSCFMNATLQCLCYTSPFQNYISSKHHIKNCKTSGYCIFCELQTLMPAMLYSKSVSVPRTIFKNLRLLSKKLRPGRQEDAQEFLRFLMEGLQNSCLKQEGRKISDMRVQETTFIHKLWGGYLRSQIKCCKCGYESNTYDCILDISLEIKGPSLRSAFKHFTDPEILDDDNKYQCDNCKKKRRAIKQFTIFEAPNIFVIHLKRFESCGGGFFSGGKINKFIKFDMELDITEYMSYQVCPKVTYSLFGVLVHYGYSSHGGHYVSYIKSADGNWYLMDDSRCQSVTNINIVLKEKAYLLFYQRNEEKVLYKSPSASPKMKNIASLSSFDSLRELANCLPNHASLFEKRKNTPTITESPKSSVSNRSLLSVSSNSKSPSFNTTPLNLKLKTTNTNTKSNTKSKPKPILLSHRNTKPLMKAICTDTSSDNDVDINMKRRSSIKKPSTTAFEWQQNTNCGEKRKHSLENDAQCDGSKSPAKKRKLNVDNCKMKADKKAQIKALKLLKERISTRKKSLSPSTTSSSSSLNKSYNNIIYGRRSYTLKLAAKSTLRSSPKIYKQWNRKLLRRATQIPTTSINSMHKWKRHSSHGTLSDSSSESVLSDNNNTITNDNNNKATLFCDDSSSSLSPELSSPKTSINTRLPTYDGSSPHTLLPIKNVTKYCISSTSIDAYLCDDDARMCAIGIGNVDQWSNANDNTGDNVRNSIIQKAKQSIVEPKDEWDLALDSGAAYPHKSKQKSNPFKHFNRKHYINRFQLTQNDQQNGIDRCKKTKKKKGNFHNKNRFHNRRKKNTIQA